MPVFSLHDELSMQPRDVTRETSTSLFVEALAQSRHHLFGPHGNQEIEVRTKMGTHGALRFRRDL